MAATNGVNGAAPPLPVPRLHKIQPGFTLLEPLSRRGTGPGMIILTPETAQEDVLAIDNGVPSALLKWAEEGYAVVEIRGAAALEEPTSALEVAHTALANCSSCQPKERIGLVAYDPALWARVTPALPVALQIAGAVVYGDASNTTGIATARIPVVQHLAGKAAGKLPRTTELTAHEYPLSSTYLFATPTAKAFHYANESVSHTRSLAFLKPLVGGPHFDLEAIWDEHTYYEFGDRSVEHTMATMVQEPYVNHIPTMTGGIGRDALAGFYAHHFIFSNPADTELELVSRTTGIDRVVDEFIYKFTHDAVIDWLVPGIPPTHRRVEVPFTAVVNIRGDRLYHEHIAWDQGSVLAQLGLMPEYLPFPYALPDGRRPAEGKRWAYRVPVAGTATADKMRDKNGVPSNAMFAFGVKEVDA